MTEERVRDLINDEMNYIITLISPDNHDEVVSMLNRLGDRLCDLIIDEDI